jgi:hypothetical protein
MTTRGRVQGRPTKWVAARVAESIAIGKAGLTVEVWQKWKKKNKRVGALRVSVGGLRWIPNKVQKKNYRQMSWDDLASWFDGK